MGDYYAECNKLYDCISFGDQAIQSSLFVQRDEERVPPKNRRTEEQIHHGRRIPCRKSSCVHVGPQTLFLLTK